MFLFFDDTSLAFLKRVRALCFELLQDTFGVTTHRSRFEFRGSLIPLDCVVFEGSEKLGFFDPHAYRLGINKRLMLAGSEKILREVITHELAHLFTTLSYGPQVRPHGNEFKSICDHYQLPREVQAAGLNLEQALEIEHARERSVASEKVIERVKKLLSLASSSNIHESEAATLKANQILRDYNLSRLEVGDNLDPTYLKRTLVAKKRNAKLQAIYDILQTFQVQPVFNQGRGQCALEICGERTNVELTDYIAHFLDHELERLWLETKRQNQNLKGALAKNSFYRGLARGYLAKHQQTHLRSDPKSREVLLLKSDLAFHTNRAYPRLSSVSTHSANEHPDSLKRGFERGRELSIRPGLSGHQKGPLRLLK